MSWDYINNIYIYISIICIKIYIFPSFFFSSKIGQFYNCNEMWQAVHFWGIIACLECIRQKEECLTRDAKEVKPSTRNALEWFGTSYCFYKTQNYILIFKKRHKIKGKIISLYLVEITIRKLRYCSLNTPHCPKSIPCGAILCCGCIRRLNTKVHASFIRGNKTKPISLPSNTAVAISIWSHQGASAITPTTPYHQHRVHFCTNLSW